MALGASAQTVVRSNPAERHLEALRGTIRHRRNAARFSRIKSG